MSSKTNQNTHSTKRARFNNYLDGLKVVNKDAVVINQKISLSRHFHINKVIGRPSSFVHNGVVEMCGSKLFEPEKSLSKIRKAKVLVIGAGGLGCELLKNLSVSGFEDITCVDMDTIDVTNLNRQFLFRSVDVGKFKATCAANFVRKRTGVKIKTFTCKIQDIYVEDEDIEQDEFYSGFDIVICGLDNLEARQWMSDKLVKLVRFNENLSVNESTIIPMIDGGTEGFSGSVHMIVPWINPDFTNRLWTFPKAKTFAVCTITNNPRKPEHCVEWAMMSAWDAMVTEKVTSGEWSSRRKYDGDNPDDIEWINRAAQKRARQFNIKGVDYFFTMGVVKKIIPAIASTNAFIAAQCVTEAIKLITHCSQTLDNTCVIKGSEGFVSNIERLNRREGEGSNFGGSMHIPFQSSLPLVGALALDLQNDTFLTLFDKVRTNSLLHRALFKYCDLEAFGGPTFVVDEKQQVTVLSIELEYVGAINKYIWRKGENLVISLDAICSAEKLKDLIKCKGKGCWWSRKNFYVGTSNRNLLENDSDVQVWLNTKNDNILYAFPCVDDFYLLDEFKGTVYKEHDMRSLMDLDLEDEDELLICGCKMYDSKLSDHARSIQLVVQDLNASSSSDDDDV